MKIPPGETHLWTVDLRRQDVDHFRPLLSKDEIERAGRFHFERDRIRFIIARGVLRTLAGRYLEQAPGSIQFSYGPRGKPAIGEANRSVENTPDRRHTSSASTSVRAVEDEQLTTTPGQADCQSAAGFQPAPQSSSSSVWVARRAMADSLTVAAPFQQSIRFNASHSGEMALYGFTAAGEIGVDIEGSRAVEVEQLAERFCAREETAAILAKAPAERQEAFFHCWTRKEAYIKAEGSGLFMNLKEFAVSIPPDDPPRLVRSQRPEEAVSWYSFAPAPGYVAASCVLGVCKSFVRYEFEAGVGKGGAEPPPVARELDDM